MKPIIMAALAAVCLATPAVAGSSQFTAYGTKNDTNGNAPLDDHNRLAALAAAANDAANLGKTTYNSISNYTCGTCININTDGDGNVINTTGSNTGPITGVQGIGSDGIQQIIQP